MNEKNYQLWQARLQTNSLLRQLVIFFGIYSVLYFFGVGLVLLFRHQYEIIAWALAAFILARLIVTTLITFFYKRQRPYQLYKFDPVAFSKLFSFKTQTPASFPSGHVISMTALSIVLYGYDPTLGIVGFMMAFLAGISRVVMGYHYVTDVLAGFFLGTASGLIVTYFF